MISPALVNGQERTLCASLSVLPGCLFAASQNVQMLPEYYKLSADYVRSAEIIDSPTGSSTDLVEGEVEGVSEGENVLSSPAIFLRLF